MATDRQHVGTQLYVGTDHASSRNGGTWTISMGSTPDVDFAVEMCPVYVEVPNVFENIATDEFRISVLAGSGLFNARNHVYTVPRGQYTLTQFVTELSQVFDANNAGVTVTTIGSPPTNPINMTFTVVGNRIQITNNEYNQCNVGFLDSENNGTATPLTRLGFDPSQYSGTIIPLLGTTPLEVTATNLPNFAGETLVFIAADTMGHANLTFGADGSRYDIIAAVPLSDTVFGGVKTVEVKDRSLHTIVYRTDPRGLSSTIRFQLLDSNLQPLDLPENFNIRIIARVFHSAFSRELGGCG